MDGIYSVFIHFFNDKSDVIFGNFFAFSWDMFKYIDHMSGDGIVVIGFNTAAKSFIDIIQTGGAIHQVFAGAQLLYRVYLIIVIFIADFPDDFFKKVFQSDDTGRSAVFIPGRW